METERDNIYTITKGDKISSFDCHVLSINFKGGGSFSTVFPISDKSYRENTAKRGRIMPDKVSTYYDSEFTTFIIIDDYGTQYEVRIDNIHGSAIHNAINKAKEYGLIS